MTRRDDAHQRQIRNHEERPGGSRHSSHHSGKNVGGVLLEELRSHAHGSKRITLEFPVLDVVRDVNDFLQPALDAGWLSDAHMTVLHLGRIPALVEDLGQAGITVDYEMLTSQLAEVWAPLFDTDAASEPFDLAATGVTELKLGHASTIVLSIAVTPPVQRLRDDARNALLCIIERNGIKDPERFMAQSPAIQQPSIRWHPHVSLPVSIYQDFHRQNIPAGSLRLSFGGLQLR